MASRKVTCTVPEKLYRRYEPFSGFINLSKLLQDALTTEIDRIERRIGGGEGIDQMQPDEMRALLKRLLALERTAE